MDLGVLWGALTLVFLLFSSVPDPARALAGQNEREEVVEAIREKHGLNDALHVRYVRFFSGFIPFTHTTEGMAWTGVDLGRSFVSDREVAEAVFQALPPTLLLASLAMALALVLGVSIRFAAGAFHGPMVGPMDSRLGIARHERSIVCNGHSRFLVFWFGLPRLDGLVDDGWFVGGSSL